MDPSLRAGGQRNLYRKVAGHNTRAAPRKKRGDWHSCGRARLQPRRKSPDVISRRLSSLGGCHPEGPSGREGSDGRVFRTRWSWSALDLRLKLSSRKSLRARAMSRTLPLIRRGASGSPPQRGGGGDAGGHSAQYERHDRGPGRESEGALRRGAGGGLGPGWLVRCFAIP